MVASNESELLNAFVQHLKVSVWGADGAMGLLGRSHLRRIQCQSSWLSSCAHISLGMVSKLGSARWIIVPAWFTANLPNWWENTRLPCELKAMWYLYYTRTVCIYVWREGGREVGREAGRQGDVWGVWPIDHSRSSRPSRPSSAWKKNHWWCYGQW